MHVASHEYSLMYSDLESFSAIESFYKLILTILMFCALIDIPANHFSSNFNSFRLSASFAQLRPRAEGGRASMLFGNQPRRRSLITPCRKACTRKPHFFDSCRLAIYDVSCVDFQFMYECCNRVRRCETRNLLMESFPSSPPPLSVYNFYS